MIRSKSDINEENLVKEMQQIEGWLNIKDIGEALYFPKRIVIETSRVCNARCPFCGTASLDQSVPIMSDKLFNKIIDEISQYSDWMDNVTPQRTGEPLMDKKIVERIRAIKQAGIKHVSISTNASLLTEKKSRGLFEAGLDDLMISIDSIDKKKYEELRLRLNYERVMSNIKTMFRMRDEIKPDAIIRIRGVSFFDLDKKEDRDELTRWEDYFNQFTKPQDRVYMKKAFNWGNQVEWDDNLPDYDWVYHPCQLPWSTMNITSNGEVTYCPEDFRGDTDIGNINKELIVDVWRNENLNRIRNLHRHGKRNELSFCQGCRVFDKNMSLENWRDREKKEYET